VPDIDDMFRGVREAASASRVFGEPVNRGEMTIVPAACVRGGAGGGGDEGSRGGGGFAIKAKPVGAFVIRNDSVEWKPVIDVGRLVSTIALIAGAWLILWRRNRKTRSRR
jgi:uncharacterized spore protein YtfJ